MLEAQPRDLIFGVLARRLRNEANARDQLRAFQTMCDQLREELEPLLGVSGVRVLRERSLTLARAEFAWLAQVELDRTRTHRSLNIARADALPAEQSLIEGLVAVLAYQISLLFTFIGQDLTLPIVQRAWQDAVTADQLPAGIPRLDEFGSAHSA